MDINLQNKYAIVCGSTQGIGKAIACELANCGANITLVARNENKLQQVKAQLATHAGNCHSYICVDFSDINAVKEKVASQVNELASLHILVNNTGGPPPGPALSACLEEFQQAFSSHLLINHLLVQTVIDKMKEVKYGRIINVISTSVKEPIRGLGVSNTIRGSVASWAKTLARELGPFGITVNNILPGYTNTERLHSIIQNRAEKLGKTAQEVAQDMRREVPLQRFAEAAEIAAAAVFLASPEASYINGINLPIDGGRTFSL